MIKELVKDEALLSKPCEAATADDADVAQDLLDTLASLEDAACLAANQIGVTKSIVAYLDTLDRVLLRDVQPRPQARPRRSRRPKGASRATRSRR